MKVCLNFLAFFLEKVYFDHSAAPKNKSKYNTVVIKVPKIIFLHAAH